MNIEKKSNRAWREQCERLQAENAALREDKERLDFGQIRIREMDELGDFHWCIHKGLNLRAAIDAARKEAQP